MEIENLKVGRIHTNCYIIKKDGKCIIIDPGDEAEKIKASCEG